MPVPIIDVTARLGVDPLLMAIAGRPLTDSANALRDVLPALDAAWTAAAQSLRGQRTGESLQACRLGVARTLVLCAAEVEALGQALYAASLVYGDADATAVPSVAH